jgi:hypothetical protein
MQSASKVDDFADDDQRRRLKLGSLRQIGNRCHGRYQSPLRGTGPGLNQGDGPAGLATPFQELLHALPQVLQAHQNDDGIHAARQVPPSHLAAAIVSFMAGHDGQTRRAGTVRDRDAGGLRRRRLTCLGSAFLSSKQHASSSTGTLGISPLLLSPKTSARNRMLSKIFPVADFSRDRAIAVSFPAKKRLSTNSLVRAPLLC